jgi:hypothetical protein
VRSAGSPLPSESPSAFWPFSTTGPPWIGVGFVPGGEAGCRSAGSGGGGKVLERQRVAETGRGGCDRHGRAERTAPSRGLTQGAASVTGGEQQSQGDDPNPVRGAFGGIRSAGSTDSEHLHPRGRANRTGWESKGSTRPGISGLIRRICGERRDSYRNGEINSSRALPAARADNPFPDCQTRPDINAGLAGWRTFARVPAPAVLKNGNTIRVVCGRIEHRADREMGCALKAGAYPSLRRRPAASLSRERKGVPS